MEKYTSTGTSGRIIASGANGNEKSEGEKRIETGKMNHK